MYNDKLCCYLIFNWLGLQLFTPRHKVMALGELNIKYNIRHVLHAWAILTIIRLYPEIVKQLIKPSFLLWEKNLLFSVTLLHSQVSQTIIISRGRNICICCFFNADKISPEENKLDHFLSIQNYIFDACTDIMAQTKFNIHLWSACLLPVVAVIWLYVYTNT